MKCHKLLSSFAFNFNLCRYITVFRIFFPAKLQGIEPSFLTRQYLKSIKLG